MRDELTRTISAVSGIDVTWDSLLSGAIGGLAIVLVTILYDRIRAWQDRRQERIGLLLLIDDEIEFNNVVLEAFDLDHSIVNTHTVSTLTTDAWDGSKAKLAQLLKTEHVATLVTYYAKIRYVQQSVSYKLEHTAEGVSEQERFPVILERIREAKSDGDKARNIGQGYLRNPEWLKGKPKDNPIDS